MYLFLFLSNTVLSWNWNQDMQIGADIFFYSKSAHLSIGTSALVWYLKMIPLKIGDILLSIHTHTHTHTHIYICQAEYSGAHNRAHPWLPGRRRSGKWEVPLMRGHYTALKKLRIPLKCTKRIWLIENQDTPSWRVMFEDGFPARWWKLVE